MFQRLRLNAKADYRLLHGHLWVYSNEINQKFNSIKNFEVGELALIENATGKILGLAYVNPNTLIAARILNWTGSAIDENYFSERIANALNTRELLFASKCYRLIYGESDLLPGLVVDRFYDTLVVQVSTAGMEKFLDLILNALDKLINPNRILIKNDGKMREVEGISSYVRWAKGEETEYAFLEENGVKFQAPILCGQKTGWFYDHRMARARLQDYVRGKRVLDVFSYIGGWGIQAAAFAAKEVICSDISELALQSVKENARLNNLTNVSTILGDAFEVMQNLYDQGEKFEVVILDPPAFIPKKKDLPKGIAAYQKANLQAMRLLSPGGILISGSCSMHLPVDELKSAILRASLKLKRQAQILEQGHQGPDHPIHPAIAETEYLKSFIAKIL